MKDKDGKEVLLTSTGTKLANIGRLVIHDGAVTSELISSESYTKKDSKTDAFVKEMNSRNDELLNTVVAKSAVDLTIMTEDGSKRGEKSGN